MHLPDPLHWAPPHDQASRGWKLRWLEALEHVPPYQPIPQYARLNPCGWTRDDPRRLKALQLISHPSWDRMIIFVILLNGITMAFEAPPSEVAPPATAVEDTADILETVYLCLFTFEMAVKLTASGFSGYCADAWNLLDSTVVLSGWAPIVVPALSANISVVRLLRLLRVLMLVRKVESMRNIVVVLFNSVMQLADVAYLFTFFMFVYGLVGLSLFKGALHWRCVPEGMPSSEVEEAAMCGVDADDMCQAGFTCVERANPQHGLISYDNIFSAFLTIFMAVSLEGWTDQMYLLEETAGNDVLAVVFYLSMITLGGFFLVQLFLAIIFSNFLKIDSMANASPAADDLTEASVSSLCERSVSSLAERSVSNPCERSVASPAASPYERSPASTPCRTVDPPPPSPASPRANLPDGLRQTVTSIKDCVSSLTPTRRPPPPAAKLRLTRLREDVLVRNSMKAFGRPSDDADVRGTPFQRLSRYVARAAPDPSSAFNRWLLVVIVLNTLAMTLQTADDTLLELIVFEVVNALFTALFVAEAALRIHAIGWDDFTADSWNRIDLFVATTSALDLFLEALGAHSRIMRALRALRILRLLRISSSMRRFEATIVQVSPYLGSFAGVTFLFTFIFAVLGKQLFAFQLGAPPPRSNFDSTWNALITVFIVVTGEDWTSVLANTLEWVSPAVSVPYFCTLYGVGNYLLVSICVAVVSAGWNATIDIERSTQETRSHLEKRIKVDEQISHLRTAHIKLNQKLQDQILLSKLGFSKKSVVTLYTMNEYLNDFVLAVHKVLGEPRDPPPEVHAFALAFTSLIEGLIELLPLSIKRLPPSAAADGSLPYSQKALFLIQFMDSASILADYDSDGDDYERRPMSQFPQLQELPYKYVRALCDTDPTVQLLHRIGEVVGKDQARLRPWMSARLEGVGYEVLLGDNVLKTGSCCSWLQRAMRRLIVMPQFEMCVQMTIGLSCIMLAAEDPDGEKPGTLRHLVFYATDIFFTSIFTVEMLFKIFVYGLYKEPEAYLKSSWNILDATIVITSLPSLLIPGAADLSGVRVLRAFRALRPLVLVRRFKGLKQVVYSLGRALPKVSRVAYVCLLLMLVYALIGMSLLMGTTASCNDENVRTRFACVGRFNDTLGLERERRWNNPRVGNFDTFGSTMLLLFECATLEMWPDILHIVVDSVGPDVAAQRDASPWMAFYIIAWILLSNFFLLQLFVGVTLETFNEIRKEADGSGLLTQEQRTFVSTLLVTMKASPKKKLRAPPSELGQQAFRLVTSPQFEIFIGCAVIASLLAMAATWYGQPEFMELINSATNYFFLFVFTSEMALKLFALGKHQYFHSRWNLFDFCLVTVWLIVELAKLLFGSILQAQMLTLMRVVRIARLVRLVQISPGIKRVLATLALSAPALGNVGLLLSLLLYIYAVLGVQLFHKVAFGAYLNEEANFTSFGMALETLFRCMTGESYNGLMHDSLVTEKTEGSRCSEEAGTCGTWLAIPFHVSFQIVAVHVVLQLVLASILDTFSLESDAGLTLSVDQLAAFRDCWAEFDGDATQMIPYSDIYNLLQLLPQPLGFGGKVDQRDVRALLHQLRLKVHRFPGSSVSTLHFQDVLAGLATDLQRRGGKPPHINSGRALSAHFHDHLSSAQDHGQLSATPSRVALRNELL